MDKVAVVADSNSGITQNQAKGFGVHILPMPFFINGETFFEDVDLNQEHFYEKLEQGAEISTSMPAVGNIAELWDGLLKEYDEIVHIPMSRGLSGSCEAAIMLSREYNNRVHVVNNQRISVTQKQATLDAVTMVNAGKSALEIKNYLEETKFDSSIYIMLNTLHYIKKGGRITPAAAALGTLLKIKPILQIQGEKLDAFAKARTLKQAKSIMIEAIKNDFEVRFNDAEGQNMNIQIAYSKDLEPAMDLKEELLEIFPDREIMVDPLSLSIACHIGPGALAIACTKKLS